MKLFDSRWDGPHGIGRFSTELLRRLDGFQRIDLPGRPSEAIDPWRLGAYLRRLRPRMFFSPGYNAPALTACPFFFCLHDLNHLNPGEPRSAAKRAYYRLMVRPAILRAQKVFTVSEFSRQAISEWAAIDPHRIVNVGNGVAVEFSSQGRSFDEFDRPYFLHVGGCRPHKNLFRLLLAWSTRRTLRECLLVCLGEPTKAARESIARLGLEGRVIFSGLVSDEKLAQLYRGATALVFVSLYEGFGLPIVEAMACGCPVITSSVASMPEVAGGAAILVDPCDAHAIGAQCERVLQDAALRESLRVRGVERAKIFHWDDVATRVREALSAYL
jgi:glycosyltransferase involved in cell wall biosynthesis